MFIRNDRRKLPTFAYEILNVEPKKEWFIYLFFLSSSKRVCRSVHKECCEHEVIYKQEGTKGSIS